MTSYMFDFLCLGLSVLKVKISVWLPSSIIDWNNPLIINKMFKVYLGDVPLKTKVCKFNIFKITNDLFYLF